MLAESSEQPGRNNFLNFGKSFHMFGSLCLDMEAMEAAPETCKELSMIMGLELSSITPEAFYSRIKLMHIKKNLEKPIGRGPSKRQLSI